MTGPTLSCKHGNYEVSFRDDALRFDFRFLNGERHDGSLSAKVSAISLLPSEYGGEIYRGNLILSGPRSLADYARGLKARLNGDPSLDVDRMLQEAAIAVEDAYHAGAKPILIRDAVEPEHSGLVVPPFVLGGGQDTLIHGAAGDLKSTYGLVVAASSHMFLPIIHGLEPLVRLRWAYIDAEAPAYVHKRRLKRLLPPGVDLPDILHISTEGRPLVHQVDRIRNIIADNGIEASVLDSVGMLAGGPPEEAQTAIAYFQAVRSLELEAALHIAHENRAGDHENPFGSQFYRSIPRSTVHISAPPLKDRVPGKPFELGLFAKKSNDMLPQPLFLTVRFTEDGRTEMQRTELSDPAGFNGHLPDWRLIQAAVRSGPRTYAEIREITGLDENAVGTNVRRHRDRIFHVTERVADGRRVKVVGLLETRGQPDIDLPSNEVGAS